MLDENGQNTLKEIGREILLIADDPVDYFEEKVGNAYTAVLIDALLSNEASEYLETRTLSNYCFIVSQSLNDVLSASSFSNKLIKTEASIKIKSLYKKYAHITELKDFAITKAEAQKDAAYLSQTNDEILKTLETEQSKILDDMEYYENNKLYCDSIGVMLKILKIGTSGICEAAMVESLQNAYDFYYKELLLFAEEIDNEEIKEAVRNIADIMKSEADKAIKEGMKEVGKQTLLVIAPEIISKAIKKIGNATMQKVSVALGIVTVAKDVVLLAFETFDQSLTKNKTEAELVLLYDISEELMQQFETYLNMSNDGQHYVSCSEETAKAFGNAGHIKTTEAVTAVSNLIVPVKMRMSTLYKELLNAHGNSLVDAVKNFLTGDPMYDSSFNILHDEEMESLKSVQLMY